MTERMLTKKEVTEIPAEDLPLAVLSRGYYSRIATEISRFDHSIWNHFMWVIHPRKFASQGIIFREVPMENYVGQTHQLKFWTSPDWKNEDKKKLIKNMEEELGKPWWERRYDYLQLLGIRLHIRQLQIPWMRICSDWADKLLILDKRYHEKHLTPNEVNEWLKKNSGVVYGKYYPED